MTRTHQRRRRLAGAAVLFSFLSAAGDQRMEAQQADVPALKPSTLGGSSARRSDPGALLWEDRHDASAFEQAFSVATLRGTAFAAGFVYKPPTGRDFVVRAYDGATGALRWQDRLDRGSDEFASGVVADGDRLFVSGTAFRSGRGYDWLLRTYEAETGTLLWETTFNLSGGNDFARGTALAAGNGLVVLGGYGTNRLDPADNDPDYIVRTYDAATGALVWQDRLDGYSGAYSIVMQNGQVFVGGWHGDGGTEDAIVRAYDAASGTLLWQHRSPGATGLGQTWTIAIRAAGDVVVAAQPRRAVQPPFAFVPHLIAFDANSGAVLWEQPFSPSGEWRWLSDIDVFGGQVFAVGEGGPGCGITDSNCDELVQGYDLRTGSMQWERRLDLSGLDDTGALVTASRGTVYVQADAEATHALPGCCVVGQLVVQAFQAADGELLWQTLGGRPESGVYNMAVDGARLFIPGRAIDPDTGAWDFMMRAYDIRGRRSELETLTVVPRRLTLTGTSGQLSYETTFTGPVTTAAHGLIPAETQAGHVIDDPANNPNVARSTGVGVTYHTVIVPAGTLQLRVSLFNSETDGDVDDLDIYLYGPNGALVASSALFSSEEQINVANPVPGMYTLMVHGYETDGPDAHYTLFSWALGPGPQGNLTVSGPTASGTVTLDWFGLTPGIRYFGAVIYSEGLTEVGRTLLGSRP